MNRRSFLGRLLAAVSAPFVARAVKAEPPPPVYLTAEESDEIDALYPIHPGESVRCGFTFRSSACGYGGAATSCDKRFRTCVRLCNQRRFGGYPLLPGSPWA